LLSAPGSLKLTQQAKGVVKEKAVFGLMVGTGLLAVTLALLQHPGRSANTERRSPDPTTTGPPAELSFSSTAVDAATTGSVIAAPAIHEPGRLPPATELAATTNRLERLAAVRETFSALAKGDPSAAILSAKQLADDTERETALMTLVLEWTQGEISSPQDRARAIDTYGLEAGLGLELAKRPDLAVQWANQLTDGPGRAAVLQRTAVELIDSDPAAAFALSGQVSEEQRLSFRDSVFAGWAEKDTSAALDWAQQLEDPTQRDEALRAIRTVAPVGIGAQLSVQDGYATINGLLPGTPAELSGQVHPGDRILALAQGDSAFVTTRDLPLADVVQMIRGAPGTTLQLQVLGADAPPDSPPRTISIVRDQLRFKH
jgi:hypothetical protein